MVLCGRQFSRWKDRVTRGRVVHSDVRPAQNEPQRSHHFWAPANKGLFQRPLAQCALQSRAVRQEPLWKGDLQTRRTLAIHRETVWLGCVRDRRVQFMPSEGISRLPGSISAWRVYAVWEPVLNKKYRYGRDSTSPISHLWGVKCSFSDSCFGHDTLLTQVWNKIASDRWKRPLLVGLFSLCEFRLCLPLDVQR